MFGKNCLFTIRSIVSSTFFSNDSNKIEATKITTDWFMWMHHTVNKIPDKNDKKYIWQKKHVENKTGFKDAYKPIKIEKNNKLKKYETWEL